MNEQAQEPSAHILIMEDDPSMQTLVRRFLGKFFLVSVCSDGLQALSLLQSGTIPDVIVADLNTPNMGGLELLEQVKASDFFSPIPVIILSAEERSEMKIKCLEKGAEDFIVKPFNPKELVARLNVILRRLGK
jgi:DNA-binding response OmpR family regulator